MKAVVAGVVTVASFAGCVGFDAREGKESQGDQKIVAGAGYTTFDDALGGCKNGNGVNCNSYIGKDYVFMSGGPQHNVSGLADGSYFFAVVAPGAQATFFSGEGLLSTDSVANRTFTTANHQVDLLAYDGPHAEGTSPQGRAILGLAPFADTPNNGGVYILAICLSGATSPSQCKYDAFRVRNGADPSEPQFPVVSGGKYYDANINGKWDSGEPGIGGWPIDYHDEVSGTVATEADGKFTLTLIADTYLFVERQAPNSAWHQTGNTVDQTSVTGAATATLSAKQYTVVAVDNSTVNGLYFGNVCVGAGGGHTLGFWSNKNGQSLIDAGDLQALREQNLYTWPSTAFDPTTKQQVRSWLLNGTATNMAIMLSVQMAATVLNIRNNLVANGAIVYAPGTTSADANGFASLTALIAEANVTLGENAYVLSGHPERAHQEALKNAFDKANNNLSFLQAGPSTCSAPGF
ncbi:MAG TPA: hypothetical protein VMZ53_20770 [Kofleriaceae bacterium]|nr:hypothetical protein [Kofleriaceae bacterium]